MTKNETFECIRCHATEELGYDLYRSGGEIYCDMCMEDVRAEETARKSEW